MNSHCLTLLHHARAVMLLLVFAVCLAATPCYAKDGFNFGIVPQQTALMLASTWVPVLAYLEQQTGYKFSFETAKNIPAFEKKLAQGKYDFAYMNPYHYVMFHRHSGYKAMARARDKQLHGIIVVRKDSSLQSIRQLNNQELAFPSPMAFGASVIPRTELKQQKVDITARYVASHDSVYRNVAEGKFIAGGGVVRTLDAMPVEVRNKLRILYQTRGYTPHAFAVHPRVPVKVYRAVRQAMLDMDKSAAGRVLLAVLKIRGFTTAKDADWDDVRKIRY